MAQPGEFFPQQFANQVLQLASANKQFNARLREQRSQAAARNFMDKQRLELAEQAQAQEGGQNTQPFGTVDAFRSKSAESAMGVRDQLQLEKGVADIKRSAKLQDVTDGALVQKALGDFEDHGFATIPAHAVDTIPGLRSSFQTRGLGGDAKTTTKFEVDSKGTTTGNISNETTLGDISEIKLPNGDVMIVGIGGTTATDKKNLADLQRTRALTRETVAQTALTKERTDAVKLDKLNKGLKAQQTAEGMGSDDGLKNLQASLNVLKSVQRIKESVVDTTEAEIKALDRLQFTDAEPVDFDAQMLALREKQRSNNNQSGVAVISKLNPAVGKKLAELDTYVQGAAIAGAKTQSGEATPGGDQSIMDLLDPAIKSLIGLTPVDLALEMRETLGPAVTKALPTNVTIQLTDRRTGSRNDATFHADPGGLIPLNESAFVIAKDIAKAPPAAQRARLKAAGARLSGTESFKIHPLARRLGFQPEGSRPRTRTPDLTQVPASQTDEAVADQATLDKEMAELTAKIQSGAGTPEDLARAAELVK